MNDKMAIFCSTSWFIQRQFDNLNRFYREISAMITSEQTRIRTDDEEFQKSLENASPDNKNEHFDDNAEDLDFANTLENTFCYEMVISIYTVIEKYMIKLCKNLKDNKNIQIKLNDLSGEGVVKAKKYMEKLCGLVFSTQDAGFLSGINAIRNVIAHGNGELYNQCETNINRIRNISQQAPGCNIKQIEDYDEEKQSKVMIDSEIELHLCFVEYCLKQGKAVFKNILKQITEEEHENV